MKKQFTFIVFLMIVMLGITGCENNLGDIYVEGSDYQYMFRGSATFYQKIARGSNGYFFAYGHYIYYLDDDTQKLVPLCNKADCLHNKETDASRYDECNAHINNDLYGGAVGIAYGNGYLYFINHNEYTAAGSRQSLYRMKADGSQKQSLYQWEDWTVEEWCIHRDVLYFVEHIYEVVEDEQNKSETIEKYVVKKLALTGMGRNQPETVYEVEEGHTVYSLSRVKAYGNYVYFTLHGASVFDTSVITDENAFDYVYLKQIAYNISTKECKTLTLPDEQKGDVINTITFWNGKLILNVFGKNQDLEGISNSYISNLDGSNAEIFQKEKIQSEVYISDGKYLYTSNSSLVSSVYEEKEYYRVYDQDMNIVDTFEMPFIGDPEIGMEEGLYAFKQKQNGSGAELLFFDKSAIGTYNGSLFNTYQKIAEIDYSPEDLAEIQSMDDFQ